jgi:hypothetical protein
MQTLFEFHSTLKTEKLGEPVRVRNSFLELCHTFLDAVRLDALGCSQDTRLMSEEDDTMMMIRSEGSPTAFLPPPSQSSKNKMKSATVQTCWFHSPVLPKQTVQNVGTHFVEVFERQAYHFKHGKYVQHDFCNTDMETVQNRDDLLQVSVWSVSDGWELLAPHPPPPPPLLDCVLLFLSRPSFLPSFLPSSKSLRGDGLRIGMSIGSVHRATTKGLPTDKLGNNWEPLRASPRRRR